MILDTDMTKHSFLLEKINNLSQDLDRALEAKDRLILMSSIMHAADISNPAMPFKEFRDWGLRMAQEFDDLWHVEQDLHNKTGSAEPLPFMKYGGYAGFKGG